MQARKSKKKIKLIELSDKFSDHQYQYPYFQCVESNIRFLLVSKITYQYEPLILIQNQKAFQTLLPIQDYNQHHPKFIQQNFTILRGNITVDGRWECDMRCDRPGLINFQLIFEPKDKLTHTSRTGTCDTIVVMQTKVDVRFLRKMSVFPRSIGHYTKWVQFFRRQMDLGYNSFHLAPIQQTGCSKSYYSIFDQQELSNDVFQGTQSQKNEQLMNIIRQGKNKGAVFFIDIVLNHTSFDSEWIKHHPDSIYTTKNTPHLSSAFQVDRVIWEWGNQIKEVMGAIETEMTQQQFNIYKQRLTQLIAELKIEEYFYISQTLILELQNIFCPSRRSQNLFATDPIEAIENFLNINVINLGSSKFGGYIDQMDKKWKNLSLEYEIEDLKKGVQNFNANWKRKVKEWCDDIVNNVMNEVKKNYLDNKHKQYSGWYPFVDRYFTEVVNAKGQNIYVLNNGWVAGQDTAEANFIYSKQFYYLRRKVNVWGDLVRIRYGQKPQDAPQSWNHMQKYVVSMATIFDGFRMDNLHGTQLHVAKYMIKKARQVNPNLIVFAELFADTEQEKAMFVRSIGINSTLKQAQYMLSGSSYIKNFHKIIGEYGPYIGSINPYFQTETEILKYCRRKLPLILVYDLTHDNKTYYEKGIIMKQIPITMLIGMMGTFVGSTKGYDQFYTRKILVIEKQAIYGQDKYLSPKVDKSQIMNKRILCRRMNSEVYGSWNGWKEGVKVNYEQGCKNGWIDLELPAGKYDYKFKSGDQWFLQEDKCVNNQNNHQFQLQRGSFRKIYSNLEEFRKSLAKYSTDFVEYRKYYAYNQGDIVIIVRETSDHSESICIIANLSNKTEILNAPILLPGRYQSCQIWHQTNYTSVKGMCAQVQIVHSQNIFQFFEVRGSGMFLKDSLVGSILPPGFACIVKSRKDHEIMSLIYSADQILTLPLRLPPLGPLDINLILFGTAKEEEARFGQSNYVLPHFKQLVYGGFAGVYQMILQAKKYNSLTIPLFENLRQGHWLLRYYIDRIKRYKYLSQVADIIERYFTIIQQIPSQLIPKYFTQFIYKFWTQIESHVSNSKSRFERQLTLACNQFVSNFPKEKVNFQTSLAAGLPHFCVGWARSWGRDTFISSELLLTAPNIYRQVIMQFASLLRHGTIPNLLDSGNNPRYNCRDSCWWFIRGVKQYAEKTGDYTILKTKIEMVFLSDDLLEHNRRKQNGETKIMILEDIIQHIFQSHANGILYREWNAGYEIDSNMNSQGFTVNLTVNQNTGFIVGGNTRNCLTWMDKMGSSIKSGTKGIPSTARCGAPVQLVGLLKHCLSAYSKLHKQGKYSHNSVVFKKNNHTFDEWANLIHATFQEMFFIPRDRVDMSRNSITVPKIVGMYRDVVFSQMSSQEYRLRPNALITLALAPEICHPKNALQYLQNVEKYLISEESIGISTLAEVHTSLYAPTYDNDDDSDIIKTAHGYSYHNGPQWVWLYGFYILSLINFDRQRMTKARGLALLQNHIKHINNDEWYSLPQLTNKKGNINKFSCNAQAWSVSSILMALQAIEKLPVD